ncbi:MAG TPA: mevalonate kinase [Anaerolineae bacterium]|nr:mevalonate kinase [Anaerolineae bacterium]
MVTASAPGKVILFGEHAVVYGRLAIAVPVTQVRATATIEPARAGRGATILATDLARVVRLSKASPGNPLASIVRLTLAHLDAPEPDALITVHSTIPIASGMGSGAAVSASIVRALARYLGRDVDDATVSSLVYAVERLYHGTPSGIDNTVVVYQQPVYFVRGAPVRTFTVKRPFTVAVGDTGVRSPTKIAVGDVRKAWEADRARYEALFDRIGSIVEEARAAIEAGDVEALGPLMDANHALLRDIGVSSDDLDRLVAAARRAGAKGAKLVGGGRGGHMIALVDEARQGAVRQALLDAGAKSVMTTKVEASSPRFESE